ncbi:putative phage tail component [Escherichia coli]|uniref:Putative phage tail component n=5 Tax=Escherichia coli TaxID=562 RepID=A0A2X1PI33_ECOLX|nr:putative phage tail component [Escherichia coli]STM20022.1 putative phage tail component [Escherichia coli]
MKTGAEAIRALAMQIPAFRQKLSDGWYQVRIAGRDTGETELSARLNEPLANGAVIHIVPRLAGAKSGGVFQAVLGAAVMAVAIWMPGVGIMASNLLFSLGASMTLGGVAQMLAPKPKTPRTQTTDNGKQNTYFSSLDNMVAQGNVLPVLYGVNRPGFPGECFICELRLPDHRFRWKHNKLFLLLPEEYGPAFPAIVDCYTSPPT